MKKITEVVQDESGNIVVGAEVYIRKQSDSSLVLVYSDNGSTLTANPVVSGSDGRVEVWAANNTLKIQTFIDGEEANDPVEYYQHYDLSVISTAAWTILDDATVGDIRTTLGVGTGDSPQFTAVNLGAATDTTITRVSAGVIAVEGVTILTTATGQPLDDDLTAIAALADPNADRILFWDDSAGAYAYLAPSTGLAISTTNLAVDAATTAQVLSNTADKVLLTDDTWAAAGYTALTDAATVAVDLSLGINFSLTIGGNRTLGAPSNTKDGQAGEIIITQDGTGSRTLAYHANWKFVGGVDPTLSTVAGTIDVLSYKVVNSTFIIASLSKAFA